MVTDESKYVCPPPRRSKMPLFNKLEEQGYEDMLDDEEHMLEKGRVQASPLRNMK